MNDWKRNGSGYYDETFVKAVQMIEGEHGMFEQREMKNLKRGEIYEYQTQNGHKDVLIVAADERANNVYISHVMLHEEKKGNYCVPVVCGIQKYADIDCVTYGVEKYYGNLIRKATDEEMQEVDKMLVKALGLKAVEAEEDEMPIAERVRLLAEIEELNDKNKKLHEIAAVLEKNADKHGTDVENLELALQAAEMERNMYKNFYFDILDRYVMKK
jgi:hypothetical protein